MFPDSHDTCVPKPINFDRNIYWSLGRMQVCHVIYPIHWTILWPIIWFLAVTVHCGQRSQHWRGHIEVIHGLRHCTLLWLKPTAFWKLIIFDTKIASPSRRSLLGATGTQLLLLLLLRRWLPRRRWWWWRRRQRPGIVTSCFRIKLFKKSVPIYENYDSLQLWVVSLWPVNAMPFGPNKLW